MTVQSLYLGFDGADPDFIDAMIADGELPNIKKIRDASVAHKFENYPAMGAAQFWTSAAIGKPPDHHGHYFFMQFKPDTYDVVPNHESELPRVTPFWEPLDREGYRVAIIDWHRMPVNAPENGMIIDNWLTHDPLALPIWHPPHIAAHAAKHLSDDPVAGGFACRPRKTAEEQADFLFHLLKRIDAKTELCVEQMKTSDWDLFTVCFAEVHDIGHYYYHLEDKRHERFDAAFAEAIPAPLRQGYRRLDQAVGALTDAAGPDANIFMIGGPGMESTVSANRVMEEITRRIDLGLGAPVSGAEAAKSAYRHFLPLNLRRRIAPFARSVRRKFANREYLRRRFFAIPHNDNAGAIRINLKGRERHGVVKPGAEYDALIEEITNGVVSFMNPDTGRSIVKRVVNIAKDYDGPHRDVLPDVFVEWDRSETPRDFRAIISKTFGEIVLEPQLRTGDHNLKGFFWRCADAASLDSIEPPQRPGDTTVFVDRTIRSVAPIAARSEPQKRRA